MILKKIIQGDSLSIGFRPNTEYDQSHMEHFYVHLGSELLASTLVSGIIRVELSAASTLRYYGVQKLYLTIDDSSFGTRRTLIGELDFIQSTGTFNDTSVNLGYSLIIGITITALTTTTDPLLLEAIKGLSAYEIAVEHGYEGTEEEWNAVVNVDVINSKAAKTTQVIAGNGLTGGGDLSGNRTLNVAATDDSIIIAADSIKVDTIDTLVSVSQTKPLSANQGRALNVAKANDNAVVHLTGAETVEGVKTFASSPIVPTPTTDFQAATKAYADSLVVGLLDYRGGFDASVNTYPTSGGSGAGGAILKGDMWVVSVGGTIDGIVIHAGDSLIANVDSPAQTTAKWNTVQSNLTYVPEDVANKSTSIATSTGSDTKYPSVKAVEAYSEKLTNKSTNVTTDAASDVKYPSVKAVKTYSDSKVSLTGNETVAGIKTFSSSPIVPTTPSGGTAAVNKDHLTSMLTTSLTVADAVLSPEKAFYTRWLADTGTYMDMDTLLSAYAQYLDQLPATQRLYIPELGAKLRTSGLNRFGVKAYDMSTNAKDAVQLTDATQSFMTVGAAPNARLGMRFVQGQTQTGLMDFDDVVFAAADSWTLTGRKKINKKGTARVYLGAAYIAIEASTIVLHSGTVAVLTGTYNFECGRTYTLEFQYSNGAGVILVNSLPIATTPLSGAITFGQTSYNSTYPFDGSLYAFHITNTRKSAYQSALDHTFLSTLFPDVESVVIGNQVWSTDNHAGTMAGDGTVIPEVQGNTTDGNAELVTGGDFASAVPWTIIGESTVTGGVGRVYSPDGTISSLGQNSTLVIGKMYRMVYDIVAIGNPGDGYISLDAAGTVNLPISTTGTGLIFWFRAASTNVLLKRSTGITDVTFDNVSIKEAGASSSTLIYDYVYAATSGSVNVKTLAATKAAAMWCHYDNLASNGAIYGKLYNWYAMHLFDLYPPVKGWRVPSKLDFDQLVANQGTATVAGERLKAKFGGFDNAYATNESGFSAIAGGYRNHETGIFFTDTSRYWCTESQYILILSSSEITSSIETRAASYFFSLRFLRNEPAGQNELSYTSGLFTTDITSVPKQIPISFGRIVNAVRIKSENALTAVEAKLYNVAGTAVATLITGKTVAAGTVMMFPVIADYVGLLQDGTVRVTAAGNSGAAVGMEIEVLTHKGVLS